MAILGCLKYKKGFQVVLGKIYLLIFIEKHEKKGAMKITERGQIGLDFAK